MLPGRCLFLFMIMVGVINAVSAHAEKIQVMIDNLVFSPVEIKAKVGDTVKWINKDIVAHTAIVHDGFDVMIEANESASLVLKRAGIVEHYCLFHPNMKGRISVTPWAK